MQTSLDLFAATAVAIVVEATPFLLLGSLVGAVIECFVPRERLSALVPKSGFGQAAAGVAAGLVLPACECGIVPVARRLLGKGVPPGAALAYMMAAPVVNPVSLASTLFAFRGDIRVPALRVALVVLAVAAVTFLLRGVRTHQVLRNRAGMQEQAGCDPGREAHSKSCCTEVGCGHAGCGHGGHGQSRTGELARHAGLEFLSMFRFLLLGAVAAAGFKTFAPWGVVEFAAAHPLLNVPGMMLLAVLLSVCSEADAFVAAAFTSFPLSAKLGFMALGPLVDLKLIPLFFTVFTRRTALILILAPTVVILSACLLLQVFGL